MTLKGSTKEFPLETLLRLLHDTKKTGELTVRGPGGEGALGLAEGRVVTAMFAGQTKPIPALGAIFKIGEAEFEFLPWDDPPPANLEGELEENLKHAEEYAKWLANVREVIPHDGIRFRLSERAADQGAVTFSPDRWRVVMAVNTQPDVTTLAANLHIDRDEALTTLAGLVRDGVIETIEAPEPPPPPPTPMPQAQEWRTAAPVEEPAPAAKESEGDWSAGLVKESAAAQPAAEPAPAAPAEPAASAEQAPAWSAHEAAPEPAPAPASEQTAPPATAWIAPVESAPQWAPSEPAPPAPPVPEKEKAPSDWGPTVREVVAQPEAARPADPNDWGPTPTLEPPTPSVLDSIPQDWGPPQSAAPEPVDDRLAALSGIFDTPAKPAGDQWSGGSSGLTPPGQHETPAPEPALGDWGTPASAQPAPGDWGAPPAAQPAQEQPEADLRLAAIKLPMPPQAPAAPEPAVPNEWAPPPSMGEATSAPKKKGGLGLGGIFKSKDAAPELAARTAAQPERAASTRAGQLAAFCNALLGEFNSGRYGKGHVDDRIAGLLMRVDEQADPIDRPLPVVDDRLDVQALERVSMPEQQAVPYLALLVSTIYTDAEKAFGRDKAKRGYKAAQSVFGGDTSALNGPDLAGKLPKV